MLLFWFLPDIHTLLSRKAGGRAGGGVPGRREGGGGKEERQRERDGMYVCLGDIWITCLDFFWRVSLRELFFLSFLNA